MNLKNIINDLEDFECVLCTDIIGKQFVLHKYTEFKTINKEECVNIQGVTTQMDLPLKFIKRVEIMTIPEFLINYMYKEEGTIEILD